MTTKRLKKCIDEYPHKFFFVHSTFMNSLPQIFETGELRPGINTYENNKKSKFKQVFFMINFIDLKTDFYTGPYLLFKPDLICDYDILFNTDWNYGGPDNDSIFIRKSDTKKELFDKLDKIYEHVKQMTCYFCHEFVMDEPIPIKKYGLGVVLLEYEKHIDSEKDTITYIRHDNLIKKIKKQIKEQKYKLIVREIMGDNYHPNLQKILKSKTI